MTPARASGGILLAAALSVGWGTAGAQEPPSERRAASGPGVLEVYGQADYDWRIRSLEEDRSVRLEAFRGRVLFINLWASWCTPCIREMGAIERLRERVSDTDVVFLAVATDGEAAVRGFLRRYGYDVPVYLEATPIPDGFGMRGLPTTWVIDGAGRIVLMRHGEAVWDTDEVEAFLRSLVDSSPPRG